MSIKGSFAKEKGRKTGPFYPAFPPETMPGASAAVHFPRGFHPRKFRKHAVMLPSWPVRR